MLQLIPSVGIGVEVLDDRTGRVRGSDTQFLRADSEFFEDS